MICVLKLKILSIGKTKEKWLIDALNEYIKRLQPFASIECIWVKDDAQLEELCKKESHLICLDPKGVLLTSEEFASFLFKQWEIGGSRLSLVIGGPEGLPSGIRQKSNLLSLSPLTFTHQMTRLIILEQIYRAFEIDKGSQYHK